MRFTYCEELRKLTKEEANVENKMDSGPKERRRHTRSSSAGGADQLNLASLTTGLKTDDAASSSLMVQAGGPIQRAYRYVVFATAPLLLSFLVS